MKKKKLAIIGSGRMAWIFGINAREMDVETHAFSFDKNSIAATSVTEHHLINIFDMDDIVRICKSIGINGVVATTELTIPIAAYVAESLGLKGIPYETSKVIADKYRNRTACKSITEICQPKYAEILSAEELNSFRFDYPVILKPTSKGGKRGITVVYKKEELQSAFEFAKSFSKDQPIIVEEYISGGTEYSVESLSFNGIHYIVQVTEKISSGPPHCVELGHHQPAALSPEMRLKVEDTIKKGLAAIGVDNSSCHTEIKIVDNKIFLIEFNARPGGDNIAWPLTELSTGFPFIKGAIQVALGDFEGFDKSLNKPAYAGVYFVVTQSAYLKPLFDVCEQYSWLYKKNLVSDDLQPLEHNDCYGTNSMIYFSNKGRPNIDKILDDLHKGLLGKDSDKSSIQDT